MGSCGVSGPPSKAAYSVRRLAACAALIAVGCIAAYWIFWRPDEAKAPHGANGTVQEAPPWQPRPPLTPEELARLPSPLDALKREAMELPENAPPEMLAVLGEFPRFRLPERTISPKFHACFCHNCLLCKGKIEFCNVLL